jgi:outer membrane immunogenic protein
MAVKAPPPAVAPAPIYSWTGFYVGLNAGYSVGRDPFNQQFFGPGNPIVSSSVDSRVSPQGGLFGGQAGYNFQTGNVVFGLEGDIQWADQHDKAGCGIECETFLTSGLTETFGTAEQRIKWFGTLRGRLGWANEDWLLYITGGGAWAGIDATTATLNPFMIIPGAFSNTTGFTKGGWVIGGGAEVRIFGPWSAKIEYLYMDLGSISDTLVIPGAVPTTTLTTNSSIHDNIIRGGINYKFN